MAAESWHHPVFYGLYCLSKWTPETRLRQINVSLQEWIATDGFVQTQSGWTITNNNMVKQQPRCLDKIYMALSFSLQLAMGHWFVIDSVKEEQIDLNQLHLQNISN